MTKKPASLRVALLRLASSCDAAALELRAVLAVQQEATRKPRGRLLPWPRSVVTAGAKPVVQGASVPV